MARRRWAGAAMLALTAVFATPAVALAASPAPSPSPTSSATTYQAVNGSLVLSAASVKLGGHVTVSGGGFTPLEPITVVVSVQPARVSVQSQEPGAWDGKGHVETATYDIVSAAAATQGAGSQVNADSKGFFSDQLVMAKAGMVTITATGSISGLISSSTVDVLAQSIGGTTTSAAVAHSTFFSGSHLTLLAAVPVFLLLGGLLFAGRRKLLVHGRIDTMTSVGPQPVAHEPFTVS